MNHSLILETTTHFKSIFVFHLICHCDIITDYSHLKTAYSKYGHQMVGDCLLMAKLWVGLQNKQQSNG